MTLINPILTTADDQFVVGESDFAFFGNRAERCDGGAILFCKRGSAEVTVNQYHGQVFRNTLILILPGSLLTFTNRTDDFSAAYLAFSRDLFSEAAFRLEPAFFGTMRANPVSYPTARVVEGANIWFQMAVYTYRDRDNMYRNTIMRNRLQNLLLESYDKLQRSMDVQPHLTQESTTRQMELFHRFVGLVYENSAKQREVSFYADKLCISTRYLSTIVRNVAHSSAKEFIDRSVLLEIKMLLQSTDLSVQEIAYRLHFPDQSYLGRYFKKHTGEAPTEYRNNKK
ncbi:helix-turn-helix domain-containing protein [uncultured Alistipes sp.]|jgi:hypothetical protein|uniref:AraC family transcriptional regulator n=1 Tax=uncultured Alistipes sp. TaxID=538949 RepID=UPI0025F40CA5|nr:helix-turn-helix domain-containing protein [uncultured Alistipes sp.]